jgi:hypothetical protein
VAWAGSSQQCFTLDDGQQRVWVAQQEAVGVATGALALAMAAGARSSAATEAARRVVKIPDIA